MAKPTTLSLGTRIVYTSGTLPAAAPYVPPSPGGGPTPSTYRPPLTPAQQYPNVAADSLAGSTLPGLCVAVAGAAPDFVGSVFHLFDSLGSNYARGGAAQAFGSALNVASWTTAGSDVTKPHWDYVDLSA